MFGVSLCFVNQNKSVVKYLKHYLTLTLLWVDFLGVHFEVVWGGEGVKLIPPSCLKLVRIMLETSNLARKYTPICSFRNYTF